MRIDLEELSNIAKHHQSSPKKTRYPVEFRREVAIALNDYHINELVQKLGVGLSTMQKWRRTYGKSSITTKRKNRIPAKNKSIAFAPIITSSIDHPQVNSKLDYGGQAQFSYIDKLGRSLSISIPWDKTTADSLFQFIGQTLMNGDS